jgi:hypothetical protein
MTKQELQKLTLTLQREIAQKEVNQWLELIRDEAQRKLEAGGVSPSAFFDLALKLAHAQAQLESIDARIQLLDSLS